ncbi:MAG: hypothetical protein KGJ84_01445 [Elusimicrobia bacterium]|nr:hypothetical protein [Elusimicrobiota bacterium]
MALIRPALLASLIYLAYAVAYPDYTGTAYHVVTLSVIAGGAVGLWILKKVVGLVEGAAIVALELAFLAGIALFVGFTMPQKGGKAPLEQWAAGAHPTRDSVRR